MLGGPRVVAGTSGEHGDEQRERRRYRARDECPNRRGNAQLALRLNQLSRWFPRPILWIAVGLLGLALRRPRGALTLLGIALGAFMIIVLNALGLFADPHFALPVAPAFVLLGAGGLLGRR